jgi:hypothetical protein
VFSSFLAVAWQDPTGAPPGGNVAAPINVGTSDQLKDGVLGVNGLAVFGNTLLSGAGGSYLNFGSTAGESGYGVRDSGGTLEFKNSGGTWVSLTTAIQTVLTLSGIASSNGTVDSIAFTDGTTQTTAGGSSPACPSGFTLMQSQGRTLGCIQNNEQGSADWHTATRNCYTVYGGRLPFYAEWYQAMYYLSLTAETDDREWHSDQGTGGRGSTNEVGTISDTQTSSFSSVYAYRCFIPAGS